MLGIFLESRISTVPQVIVGRWGKNLAVRFPTEVARAAGFGNGERVEVFEQEGEIVIRKAAPSLSAEELFRGRTPDAWRDLYADAYDWGPDRGRENVEG
jgi:antitoxin component of MazEF toxin-antitoxin module